MNRRLKRRLRRVVGATGMTGALLAGVALPQAASGRDGSRASSPDEYASGVLSPETQARMLAEVDALNVGAVPQDVAMFLALPRDDQRAVLEAAGFDDPGGPLSDADVQKHLLGQWLHQNGRIAEGAALMTESGLMTPAEALQELEELDLADFEPTTEEIDDEILATGSSHESAAISAQLQSVARILRPIARALDSGYLYLSVSRSTGRLRYASTSSAPRELFSESSISALIDPVSVAYSESDLAAQAAMAVAALQARGYEYGRDFAVTTYKDPVEVRVSADAA